MIRKKKKKMIRFSDVMDLNILLDTILIKKS